MIWVYALSCSEGDLNIDTTVTYPTEPSSEASSEPDNPPEDTGSDSDEYVSADSPYRLEFIDRLDVPQAQIWNYTTESDGGFFFSHMQSNELVFRQYDMELNEISSSTMVASRSDIEDDTVTIADHAMHRMGDRIFFALTTSDDRSLYLTATDLSGNRLSFITVQDSGDIRSNDPQMFQDGDAICIRWGRSGFEKNMQCFDEYLNPLGAIQVITTETPTVQLGTTLWVEDEFWVFSGNETQRNLLYSRYDSDWESLEPFQYTILNSENDEWNWAPTGVVFAEEYDMWIVAYTHMNADGGDEDARGRLALFDKDFNLLSIRYFSFYEQATYRPHLLWKDDLLILSYDAGPVLIERWQLVVNDG